MFKGVIIEESLENKSVLKKVKIVDTDVEEVTEKDKTPWVKQWTMHSVEIAEEDAEEIADEISKSLDSKHDWYADFKNNKYHIIIYSNKIFKVDLNSPTLYKDAKEYGISIGIPEYQVDFDPTNKVWDR